MRRILTVIALIALSQLGGGANAAERIPNEIGTGCESNATTAKGSTVVASAPCVAASAGALRVIVEGLRSSPGVLLIGLYDSAGSFDRAIELAGNEGFLNDPSRVAGVALRITAALNGGVVFRNLEPGRYAIIVFHDENANGRLDKNFFGVPTEPYGFSNDAQGFLGPPSFDDAAIWLGARDEVALIDLIYHAGGFQAATHEEFVPPHPGY